MYKRQALDALRQERSQLLKGKSADEAEAVVAKREKELTHALDGARLGVETLHNRLLGLQGEMKQIAATVGDVYKRQFRFREYKVVARINIPVEFHNTSVSAGLRHCTNARLFTYPVC